MTGINDNSLLTMYLPTMHLKKHVRSVKKSAVVEIEGFQQPHSFFQTTTASRAWEAVVMTVYSAI